MTSVIRGSDNFDTSPVRSTVRLQGHAGYGSTNTLVARFTNTLLNQGADITYADSAALGGSFTVNVSGMYAVQSGFSGNAAHIQGISVNSTQLTTGISSITAADCLAATTASAANQTSNCAWTGYLQAGDVVRAHRNAANAAGTGQTSFTMTRVF